MFTVLVPLPHMSWQPENAGYGPPHAMPGSYEGHGNGRELWHVAAGEDVVLSDDRDHLANSRWDLGPDGR